MLHCLSCPCKTGTQKARASLLTVWAGTLCYHTLCGTGQQVGKAGRAEGYAGCRAGIGSLWFPASWQVGNRLTQVLLRSMYLQAIPQEPWRLAGQIQRKSIPCRIISFPEKETKKNQLSFIAANRAY